ncbi:thioredoxin family protein [Maribacter sp. 2210JD10-5]|uniref:thioredoxin family protein n=1 Tax=Maribacter sp. 2210JD10-5 TaxID=3386272 RepID=UPI0039BC3F5D
MKIYTSFIIAIAIAPSLFAQLTSQEILFKNGSSFLIGPISVNDLSQGSYANWYRPNYDSYGVDSINVSKFKNELKSYHILVFLGTWCGDSKREVPRLMKILDTAEFPSENLKMVALDRRKAFYKKSPTGEEWGLGIKRVPTIIFYKHGKEINRIIESPNSTLEKDMLTIMNGTSYEPHKAKSLHFD